jgi:hypothetical protein
MEQRLNGGTFDRTRHERLWNLETANANSLGRNPGIFLRNLRTRSLIFSFFVGWNVTLSSKRLAIDGLRASHFALNMKFSESGVSIRFYRIYEHACKYSVSSQIS